MKIAGWGIRHVVVEHRPLAYIWVDLSDGSCVDLLASATPLGEQLARAIDVAAGIADAERFYDSLIASGEFETLDEVDEQCRQKFAALEFATEAATRIHD